MHIHPYTGSDMAKARTACCSHTKQCASTLTQSKTSTTQLQQPEHTHECTCKVYHYIQQALPPARHRACCPHTPPTAMPDQHTLKYPPPTPQLNFQAQCEWQPDAIGSVALHKQTPAAL